MIDRKKLTFLIAILIGGIASSACAQQGDLVRGFSSESNEKELFRRFVRELNRYPSHMLKEPIDPEIYYAFSGKTVGKYRVKEDEIEWLGGWPLTRWQHLERPPEILNALRNYSREFSVWREKVEYTSHNPHSGCLNNAPLRYGDIDGDGISELVLFLNGELIIFSIDQKKIVFSAFIDASDWLREEWEMRESDDGKAYRHFSAMLAVNGIAGPAHRAYTKVYFGDFDEDGNPDILAWEKVYASNTVEEPAGFHLVAQRWHHFERNTDAQSTGGEYLPKGTPEADIQAWLADNNLTWQQGYPSQSECPGEEGELIPEMHDPLLNDPDVLK